MPSFFRWVHNENVEKLPFADDEAGRALAASVGATVAELNAEPVDPIAAEAVFDALSGSMAGFVPQDECDQLRKSFLTSSGGLDEESFGAALSRTRRNIFGVLVFGPGLFVFGGILTLVHWWPVLLENTAPLRGRFEVSYAQDGPAVLLLPALAIGAFVQQSLNFVPAGERDEKAAAASTYQADGMLGRPSTMLESNWARSQSGSQSGVQSGGKSGGKSGVQSGLMQSPSRGAKQVGAERPTVRKAADGRTLDYKEIALAEQDELFLEKMARKKRGELEDEDSVTPMVTDDMVAEYYAKVGRRFKSMLPFLAPDEGKKKKRDGV